MNTLYPIFLKPSNLKILIVGGGKICYEKLFFLFKNSPQTEIDIVSKEYGSDTTKFMLEKSEFITYRKKSFQINDLIGKNIVIVATDDRILNGQIVQLCNEKNILVNVADSPELCDFFLCSIITKGDLKIAISTNGKSPTFAKRFREILEDVLPDSTHSLINNLNQIRNDLNANFKEKVEKLNQITSSLVNGK